MALSGIRMHRLINRVTPKRDSVGGNLKEIINKHTNKQTAEEPEDTLHMRSSYFADRMVLGNEIPPMEEASAGLQIIKPQRKSILASDFMEDEEKSSRADVLKKRRGSIFGNVDSSLFGN